MNRRLKKLASVILVSASLPLIGVQVAFGNTTTNARPSVPAPQAAAPGVAAPAGLCVSACQPAPSGWIRPVDAPIWGGFRTAERPNHLGVDIGASRGTPIRAAASGVVVRVRCNVTPQWYGCDQDGSPRIGGCGWYVDIRHNGDIYTRYCHMLTTPPVAVDQAVNAGDVIGKVGSSGNSSAPHLHYEVRMGHQDNTNAAVDPVAFMSEQGAPLG
jgi:murein DD-endopeptidase MepM/ murein hydrolase activator NlpD